MSTVLSIVKVGYKAGLLQLVTNLLGTAIAVFVCDVFLSTENTATLVFYI